jgi:imidazolonepropionase-like amidohydrolase
MLSRALLVGLSLILAFLAPALPSVAQRSGTLKPAVFALRDARVVVEPGKVLPKATVVIRDGLIDAVGPDVKPPADALVMEGAGLTVYPGFIDALSNWGFDPALRRSETGAPEPTDLAGEPLIATPPDHRKGLTPEFQVSTALRGEDQAEEWRKVGFTAHLIAPDGGFIVGQSALVSLSNAAPRETILRAPVAQHIAFRLGSGNDYPRALMGVIAHCRQTLLDAGYYQRSWAAYEKGGRAGKRPPLDPALAELEPVLTGKMPVAFEADTRDGIHKALDFAAEFQLRPMIYGGRDAWRVADRLKAENVPVLLRVNFLEQPQTRGGRRGGGPFADPAAGAENEKTLPQRVQDDHQRQLKEEMANAARLHKVGVRFAISAQGQPGEKPWDKFRENLRKAIAEGLPAEAALRALTSDAARILGVEKQLGTVEKGKAAHLVVMNGDFQEADTKVRYVFSDGVRFVYDAPPKPQEPKKPSDRPLTPEETKQLTTLDFEIQGAQKRIEIYEEALSKGGLSPDNQKQLEQARAEARETLKLKRQLREKLLAGDGVAQGGKPRKEQATEIDSDRKPKTHTGGNVLIRGATVLTVTNGTHPKTDILIERGHILKVGENIDPPTGVTVIDATGMFVMPGIIDTHCHFAISGGVNEFSLSVVPEVRVRDVIDGEDVQIYRALAGGVTTARLLHGSANVIGGQDAVIKLKYGEPANRLLLADAPRGVKFALGENVKRTDGRFPNTRLGVEAVLVRAFTEAQAYRKTWDEYEKAKRAGELVPPEPRRDLRLEALADILKGDLKVHCHCYRADEILMLLRVADRFGFKIKSLQHVLEGYKIAAEIADHGASCSTFSDWWAYKIEAYDAIPFNSALLHEAGATVCLKSDSNELMRHLYQEAAKCVKYGGMSETDALKAITLNGAKQLGLEKRIGSIEIGKDADLAIFNGHPLNSYSRCEMALVEGEVYFQRSDRLTPVPSAKEGPAKPVEFRPPVKNPNGKYAILNVTLHPANDPAVPNAGVVVEGGKVRSVLKNLDRKDIGFPNDVTVVNGAGLHLYPGLIDAGTVLGLTELGSAKETHDFAEGGDFQPDLRASIAINPDSELIPVTRANGVLSVVTRPTGSLIAGQSALINLNGWVPKEMAVVDPLALHVEFPSVAPLFTGDPTLPAIGRAIARKQREEKVRRVKELFAQALAYDDGRKEQPDRPVNPRLEALVPYARGQKPVVIQANRKQEILDALKLADELKLKVILSGAIDSWKVTDELKKRDVPVILGPLMTMPAEMYDPYDAPFACAARLHEAGVRFCIRSAGSANTRNLPYEAAMAASYGLPPEEALKAVTLYPAQILGVEKELGSIETGKRANLVLTNGDLLQASTQVLALFIDGRPLEPTSKHTRLYERYKERLQEVKAGRAPLGTK